jgi:methyl-accepting chemotaxis protein
MYTCHAGLTEFSEPVLINGEVVAKVIGGQVITKEINNESLEQLASKFDIDVHALKDALSKVPTRTEDSVTAASKLLADIITQFINSEYYMTHNEKKVAILETEVKNVLEDTNAISAHTEELRHISKRQNILALNASIEAGRAGEAGKGFSVVADQMADLSKQSSDIYSSITTYAKNIDSSIHKLDSFFNDELVDELDDEELSV